VKSVHTPCTTRAPAKRVLRIWEKHRKREGRARWCEGMLGSEQIEGPE